MEFLERAMRNRHRQRMNWLKKIADAVACIGTAVVLCGSYWAEQSGQELVEETYTVKYGDTMWGIASHYIDKNTGGRREIREFMAGIRELNPELLYGGEAHLQPGQKIRVNYWVKK